MKLLRDQRWGVNVYLQSLLRVSVLESVKTKPTRDLHACISKDYQGDQMIRLTEPVFSMHMEFPVFLEEHSDD